MKGPKYTSTKVQFELTLVDAKPGRTRVKAANRDDFLLQKGAEFNSAVIALRNPLDGPQEVHLELKMSVRHSGIDGGKAVANLIVYISEHRK